MTQVGKITPLVPSPAGGASTHKTAVPASQSFAQALDQAQTLRFSNHAQKRIEKREIQLGENGLARLTTAVDRAAQRGGKDSLVLMDNLAFIVNVKERLVVTALDTERRGEGVFTQIDSVVIVND